MRLHQLAINDEGFVFDPSTGESFTLNHCGLFIVQALKSGRTADEIAKLLPEKFDEVPETAERDVLDFISHLKSYHLM
ncbi:MAG: PqqD family protein [Calditrichia bacterium]